MADKEISTLTAGTALGGTEVFHGAQGGNSRKFTATQLNAAVGTSFPGSPTTGDRFFRTDRNIEYVYDGTRWLSTFIISEPIWLDSGTVISATQDFVHPIPFRQNAYSIYIETVQWTCQLTNGTTASNYFAGRLKSFENTGAVTTSLGSGMTSQSATQNAWVTYSEAINAVVASTEEMLIFTTTETGTATSRQSMSFTYRLVG